MSLTGLSVPRGEMGMNPIRRVTRVGLRMLSTTGIALLNQVIEEEVGRLLSCSGRERQ